MNKTQILVPCFIMLINALRDAKTKMLNFQYKNGCKGCHRSNLHWHYIKNLTSLGILFIWKISYLYQEVHTKPLFWSYVALLHIQLCYLNHFFGIKGTKIYWLIMECSEWLYQFDNAWPGYVIAMHTKQSLYRWALHKWLNHMFW